MERITSRLGGMTPKPIRAYGDCEATLSQGLKAWGTYNTGAYRQYLPQAGVANQ